MFFRKRRSSVSIDELSLILNKWAFKGVNNLLHSNAFVNDLGISESCDDYNNIFFEAYILHLFIITDMAQHSKISWNKYLFPVLDRMHFLFYKAYLHDNLENVKELHNYVNNCYEIYNQIINQGNLWLRKLTKEFITRINRDCSDELVLFDLVLPIGGFYKTTPDLLCKYNVHR